MLQSNIEYEIPITWEVPDVHNVSGSLERIPAGAARGRLAPKEKHSIEKRLKKFCEVSV